jgi:ADP-ribosyl-[dinitrogen reductase] hydrolase
LNDHQPAVEEPPMTDLPITHPHQLDRRAMDRALGALVGSAVGDALGAPFEFQPAGRYSARFPEPVVGGVGEMVGGGGFGWEPGEFTDDTQMALAMAESLVAHGGIDRDDLWARWRAWAQTALDVGITTSASLSATDWAGAAEQSHAAVGRSASNGALMRVTPLGIACSTVDPAVATGVTVAAVLAQAQLTHFDPAAGWGAAIAAELTRRTILGADPIDELPSVVALLPDDVRSRYEEMLAPGWQPHRPGDPSNGSVWTCLAQAVWALRRHTMFHDVVVAAIDLGEDTDTVACVAGALAGARFGFQAIPGRWTTYVHGRVQSPTGWVHYDRTSLQALAFRLTGAEPPHLSPLEDMQVPVEILDGVHGADLTGAAAYARDGGFAVLSLCRVGDRFKDVEHRREVCMFDETDPDRNPALQEALVDAVDTIDAWRAEGKPVLVHCHGGRSRTALLVKAWAMRRHGWTEQQAHDWLQQAYPRYSAWNHTFREFLRTDWDRWAHPRRSMTVTRRE